MRKVLQTSQSSMTAYDSGPQYIGDLTSLAVDVKMTAPTVSTAHAVVLNWQDVPGHTIQTTPLFPTSQEVFLEMYSTKAPFAPYIDFTLNNPGGTNMSFDITATGA